MSKVTNNGFSHLRSRNEAFHKPRVPTGYHFSSYTAKQATTVFIHSFCSFI